MLKKKIIVDLIIVLIIILFLDFFSLNLFYENSILKSAVFGCGLLLILISITVLFQKGIEIYPLDGVVLVFIFSMILSAVMAYAYWDQSFSSSLLAYRRFYIYFLYFVLIFFRITSKRIERIIIILFFLSLIVFLIDFITFPDPLFSYRSEERRNGITVFFFGQGFTFLGAFYFLKKYLYKTNIQNLILFVISSFFLFFLTQSRMNLLGLIFGSFLSLIASTFRKKYLIAFLLIIIGGIFYSSSDVFNGIKEESKGQAKFYREDVRMLAQSYFLSELQGGTLTILFGNGVPAGSSKLGSQSTIGSLNGFWTSDVGLTGIYSYFGILGVIVWLLFFYLIFKIKNSQNSIYLKAYFVALLITAISGYSIFDPGYMPSTILALYLSRSETSYSK